MKPHFPCLAATAALALLSSLTALAQQAPAPASAQALSWDQVKARFEAANPTLRADSLSVDEMKAQEITAYLRPNPTFTMTVDGTQVAPNDGHWTPFSGTDYQPQVSYLHERDHKRELRLKAAQQGTQITQAQHEDLQRTMTFTLRSAFIQTLQARTVVAMAKTDLEYYDHIIKISQDRYNAGDIAQIDLDRIELLRVQYETEIQTALVNLRTSKIQLLQLMDDHTPVEQFDVTGAYDFSPDLGTLEDFRKNAADSRPDLRAALQTLEQADTNHRLAESNGSTDPTIAAWYTKNASTNNPYADQTIGASFNVPLRIFDHNQGEKQRTQIDIGKTQQLSQAARNQVFSDVDTAYAQLQSDIELLKPYKAKYNEQATRVRDTVTYSYQHGGASLVDMLNAQSDYRTVQLAYIQLIGTYLTAAGQLNLAVGREVIQ